MTNETTPSRFAPFSEAETDLIATGLELLQPDEGAMIDLANELEPEARHAFCVKREARLAAEATDKRAADYRIAEEARAKRLLAANDFSEEQGGGGCLIMSRYFPRGTRIWATCYEGGRLPEFGDHMFGVYHPDVHENSEAIWLVGYSREYAKDGPCFIDALRKSLAVATALDSAIGLPLRAGPIQLPADIAAEAAELVDDMPNLCPSGFQPWTDGIAQGFRVYQAANQGCVILSDMFGQEDATAESWSVTVFTGEFVFDGDNAEGDRELRPVHEFTMENTPSVDAAIAAALAMVAALPVIPVQPDDCEGHRDTGRGVCAHCGQPMPESL